jgi:ribosomal-protein-alanine N-acetyltransferase
MMITTGRLLIRDFVPEDWVDVHSYASEPEVTKYMIWGPNTEKETKDFIQLTIAMQQQQPRIDFELAVVLKETNTLIGGSGIHVAGPKIGEIGYCFNPLYWQKGYASEAAAALIQYGFQTLGLHRIYATCRPENIGSAKVMEKVGMQREGRLREHMWHGDKWCDSFLYSILDYEVDVNHVSEIVQNPDTFDGV